MSSERSILSIKYSPVSAGAAVRRGVGGFLRYIQYRDHHQDTSRAKDVDGLVRYVAYRDSAVAAGRLFNREGQAGDDQRKQLTRYIARSVASLQPDQPGVERRQRACYRLVISPENTHGLDLRRLAGAVMSQLERDLGDGPLPPWIAAEHRNTAHPHVHVVLAARREMTPGQFRTVIVTKRRLARMKEAMMVEIDRQRGERTLLRRRLTRGVVGITAGRCAPPRARARSLFLEMHWALLARSVQRRATWAAARLARQYQSEAEREAERRGWERERER